MRNLIIRGLTALILTSAIILVSCQTKVAVEGPWVQKIDSPEVSKIVIGFARTMKVEKHLELEDSWVAYNDNIKRICLQFTSQRLLTVYDARLLMVELVEEFLYRLNNNSIVSFELERYPFTADDIDVKISFESYYGRYIDELYIGLTWLQAGCVHFYAFDRKDRSINGIDWDHTRFEPYTKSRELALIKKEVDLPYTSDILEASQLNPPKKPSSYIFERYYKPTY